MTEDRWRYRDTLKFLWRVFWGPWMLIWDQSIKPKIRRMIKWVKE